MATVLTYRVLSIFNISGISALPSNPQGWQEIIRDNKKFGEAFKRRTRVARPLEASNRISKEMAGANATLPCGEGEGDEECAT